MAVSLQHDWEITDEITVGEELGRGSYGRVCLAEWKGAKVAVKMLHDIFREAGIPDADLTVFLHKFAEEWETMKSLRHPNVLQLYGVSNPEGGLPMMIMELLEESLEYRLKAGPLSNHSQLFVLHGIACGLRYLHERPSPVVHRDLASKNILVSHNLLQVKIGDLGVAKALTDVHSTRGTTMPGTELYMPPEVRSGVALCPSLDIFSFGVIMIETIVGRLPSPLPLRVGDPRDPYRYPVLSETERRQADLNDIPADNRLHPMIIQTLDIPDKRPPASQISTVLSSILRASEHGQSHSAVESCQTSVAEEEIGQLRAALSDRNEELEESRRQKERAIGELNEKLTENAQLNESIIDKDDELARLRLQLQQVNTSSETLTKLKYLSGIWKQWQATVSGHIPKGSFEVGWKSSSSEMPRACVPVMAVYDNRILLGNRDSSEMFVYDVNTCELVGERRFLGDSGEWSFEGLAVHHGQIYALLYDSKNYQLGLYIYNIDTDKWTEVSRKPEHYVAASSMVIVDNKIFVLCGQYVRSSTETDDSGDVFSYDLASNEWRTVSTTPPLTARNGTSCVVLDKRLLIAGGGTYTRTGKPSPCNLVEVLSLETGQCSYVQPSTLYGVSLASNESDVVISTGGSLRTRSGTPQSVEDNVELLDLRCECQWIPLPSLPRRRVFHASLFLPSPHVSLFLAGGLSGKAEQVPWIDIIRDPFQ